jgi:signal transduction histidine kinase/ligand-binding sensor domain-containing protein
MVRIFHLTLITLLFFVNANICVYGQQMGLNTEKPLSSLIMDQWTGLDGLVSNNLTSVNQTSSNFIWITTFNGILRFDGVNFDLFDKSSIPFLSSNAFYKTFEDSKGNLWFCSQSSGVIKYSNHTFEQLLPDGANSLSVRSICEDRQGNLWFGTNNEGLYLYRDQKLSKIDVERFDLSIIMDIIATKEGDIYIATNSDGLLKYKNGEISKVTIKDGLNHNALNKLYLAKDGTIYVGSLDGLFYIRDNEKGEIDDLRGLNINDIEIDDYKNIWIAAEQGLFMVNVQNNEFKSFTDKEGLPGTQVSDLCFDHENSLWLSTKKAGLVRLRDGSFINVGVNEGLSSNNVNIIVENKGRFFVGCDDGNVSIIDGNRVTSYEINTPNYNQGIRDIHFENDGEVFIANYQGLLIKKGTQETLLDLNKYGASNGIRRILKAQDAIWLATRASGVVKISNPEEVTIYNSTNYLESDYILALEQNKEGDIYVGTHSGGVSVIRKNGEVENRSVEEGKSGILIFNIYLLENDVFWIATNIGMYKYDGGSFEKVLLDEKLNAETIFDIEIINEYAWLTSNRGLIRVNTKDLDAYLNNALQSVPGRIFDRYDGMASHECTGATRITLGSDNKLWIPTLGGVAVLDPEDVDENQQIPKVYITDFLTDFKPRPIDDREELSFEPGMVRYEFKFTSLSFIAPPKVQFMYKLSGIDRNWVDAEGEREVVYTNLPKGNYTFSVIASNNDGLWNETGAKLSFKVEPYFYETTLFYLGVILLLALMIWGIIILRVRTVEKRNAELKKLNEELDRFVYSASHDLRAPLSSVLGLVEIARLETTIEAKQKCLNMINESVLKLDGFINDIIDYSRNQRIDIKPKMVDLEHEVNEALNELRYLDKENLIEKIIEIDGQTEFITDARRLNIVLKNIISNAIRYHDLEQQNPYIKINVQSNTNMATISIADNGIGIEHSHLENIFKMFYRADESSKGSGLGLYIVKETIDKMGGKIEVESQLNFGTTFTIKIPSMKWSD